jgi:4'-phosphopantetheinyl transferase
MIWQNPPTLPRLTANQVHIWRANLDLPPIEVTRLTTLLAADEITRASKFRFPEHKRRFIVARGILRQLLSNYLDIDPKSLKFAYSDRGKPQLIELNLASSVQFNLSHSQEYALFGFTTPHLIGVDLEYLRPMPDALKIAQRFFSAQEFDLISNLAIEQRDKIFFQLWTAKEAYLKAIGIGLAGSLANVEINLEQDTQTNFLILKGNLTSASDWSMYACVPATNYVATVAIQTQITEQQIKLWNWN